MQEESAAWYYLDPLQENRPTGPISRRDLDVLLKTNVLDSDSYVFIQGLTGWTQVRDIPSLCAEFMEDLHEVMIRAEEHFTQKKPVNKKERLKEIAKEQGNKNTGGTMSDNKEPDKVESESSEEESEPEEKRDPKDPLFNIDKMVEVLAKEVKLDLGGGDDNAKKDAVNKLPSDKESHNPEPVSEHSKDISKTAKHNPDAPLIDLEELKKQRRKEKKKQKAKEKKKNKWYEARIHACIYVKGLPKDVTRTELVEFFSRAGVLRLDPETGQEKIKLYKEEDNVTLKGDATIFFAKPESVEVAVDNLNGRDIRPGFPLIVERAQFQQKGDYKAREKKELDEVAKIRLKVNQEKMFSWNEGDEGEGLRIVILKNMFTPEQVIEDPTFAHDLEEAVKEECESQVGPIKKIILHEFNPEGIVQIKFNEPKDAEACIALMNGRFFNGKELECFYWDGKTNYRVTRDTHQDQMKRADDFGKWLESNMDNVIEGQNGDEEHESDEDEEMGDGDKTPEEV